VSDTHPVVLLHFNNFSSEAWARTGAHVSFAGRVLGCLHASLLICNPVRTRVSHIPSSENVVVDTLSHVPSKSALLATFPSLVQTLKELNGCHQFLANVELISCIMDALLQGVCTDSIALNRQLLMDPRKIISSLDALT
jgi:hypothetical protein